jgi:LPXTG-motif cell wall-anchored protein
LVAPFALVDWKPFGVRASIYLLGIGLTLLVGQVFIVLAYRYASAVKVGPFIYTVIVFTALIDWVLWNRAPTLFVLLGMALVIGGGIIAIRKKSEASRQQANGGAEKMASRPER